MQGLEGQKITRVACGSSHSVAWTTVDVATPSVHEPVLFQTARDPLGASYLGNRIRVFSLDRRLLKARGGAAGPGSQALSLGGPLALKF